MKKRFLKILSGFVLLMSMLALTAAPAAAAGGTVKYGGGDRTTLTICHHWGTTSCQSISGNTAVLYPGQTSTRFWYDTDGFYVPRGCYAYISPTYIYASGGSYGKWAKISSEWSGTVTLKCR